MYRNAARLFVTESANPQWFKLGKGTGQPSVRYLIVHKTLVLDNLIENGRAATLRVALQRGEDHGLGRESEVGKALLAAAGSDEDEEDVFVAL